MRQKIIRQRTDSGKVGTLLILFFLISTFATFAQISEGGTPLGLSNGYAAQINYERMPQFDLQQLRNEDAINDLSKGPFRFGYNHLVNYNQQNSGTSFLLPDGGRLWLLGVRSGGALSINLAFNNFYLPEGAKMFIYNPEKNFVIGAFTQRNNDQSGFFATDLIAGEVVVIEYYEPLSAANQGYFNLFRVTHGYRGVEDYVAKSFNQSGACQVNTNCPLGANWQSEKKGVVCLVVGGNEFCTGSLVNDVPQDGKPYVLTARHCSYPANDWASWVFRFNWEAPTCTTPGSSPASLSLNTAVFRARNPGSDFCLVEITGGLQNGTVPASFNTYFNGWSNANVIATSAVGIHHPSGDIKKISSAPNATISSTYSGASCWRVGTWTTGCTEPGSSGSPLFDQNHRIVGQLFGGPSACGQPPSNMNDYYGKFSVSWNTGTVDSTRLRNWLDPNNTGATTLNGFDPNNAPVALDANVVQILSPLSGSYCVSSITPSFILKNHGLATLTSVTVNWKLDNNAPNTFAWTGNLITNATATVSLPVISVGAGAHTYSVYTSLPNGSPDMNTLNDSAGVSFTIVSPTPLVNLPVNQGFEIAGFPPTNWTIINPDSPTFTWQRTTSVSGFSTSTACTMMDNYNYSAGIGQSDIMQTPYINFTSATAPLRIYMDVAYAQYDASSLDSLIVSYSLNCGLTWTQIYAKGQNALATNGGGYITTSFTPTATQWRKDSIVINSLAGQPAVLFAFENVSGYGNNLYLDNINIMQGTLNGISSAASESSHISVYPNPSNGNVNILLDKTYSGNVNVDVYDALGEKVYSENFVEGKNHSIEKNFSALSKGIYFLHITQGNNSVVRKIVLTK